MNDEVLTQWLQDWSDGDSAARDRAVAEVYQAVRQIAQNQLGTERAGHTLQPTALANEALLKLFRGKQVDWRDRVHFFAVAARAIRQILTDSGRARMAAKRGQGRDITLLTSFGADHTDPVELLALDAALNELEAMNETQARIVELRYFGGLTIEETAEATGLSAATINRHWRAARAFLHSQLESGND